MTSLKLCLSAGLLILGACRICEATAFKVLQAARIASQAKEDLAARISELPAVDTSAANQWGYGYSDLLADLEIWRQSPYVWIDSIGASVQGRALWMITIQEGQASPRPRVFVHARTHPSEVQAQYVAMAGINFLIDTTEEAQKLRQSYAYQFIPMYNPDGVELGWARLNADSVNLEANWNVANPEPEVVALRAQFEKGMADSSRIAVALNLHSDRFNCTRFFFYHDSGGTSPFYTQLEQTYIGDVQSEFPEGIEAWHFVKSWTDSTGTQYPEGWWWTHYQDSVMALTYEDANCPTATAFEKTGRALVVGSATYIQRNRVSIRMARRGFSGEPGLLRFRNVVPSSRPQGTISINVLGRRPTIESAFPRSNLRPLGSYLYFR